MRRYAKTSGIDGENRFSQDPGHQITYHTVIVMFHHSTFRHPLHGPVVNEAASGSTIVADVESMAVDISDLMYQQGSSRSRRASLHGKPLI
jgi:hypothetical protein